MVRARLVVRLVLDELEAGQADLVELTRLVKLGVGVAIVEDEVRLQALFFCAAHHRTEKDGFEFTAVIGEVTMRLAKDGNDLRHLETELTVLVGERGAVTLRLVLLPFGRVRPNLDALPGKRSPVACAAYGATHPEATLADPLHDRRALAVVIGPARHRSGRCEALRVGGQQEPGNPGCQDGAASGEEVAAVEDEGGHVTSSWRPFSCSGDGTATDARHPEFSAVVTKCQLREARVATGRNNSLVNGCAGATRPVI